MASVLLSWSSYSSVPALLAASAAAPLPSPSCMLNNESCPIPRGWVADWSLVNSTALMAVGAPSDSPDGFYPVHRWGYVTLDWSTGWKQWIGTSSTADPTKTTCEATSSANCVRLKQAGKVKRCGIYHNMELSLQWLESERAVMDEEHVKAGWFLRYPNGSVFDKKQHVQQSHVNMSQWIIDWRNQDAADYFVEAILNSTFLPGVDATFTDDLPGVPAEHPEVQPATQLSNSSLAHLQRATQSAEMALASALAVNGKFCWDCVGGEDGPEGSSYSMNQQAPPNNTAGCVQWFRHFCKPEMQGRGMLMGFAPNQPSPNETVAAFLIARGPYAFIGGRELRDSHEGDWHPLFGLDVGQPLGLCAEMSPRSNAFERSWTRGKASFDCNNYQATLEFEMLPESELY